MSKKKDVRTVSHLFRGPQANLFEKSVEEDRDATVECLGQTFESDEARREHYLGLLAERLKDPEFRKIPGFPQGTDEDILRLSDPPYYTACPNPFLGSISDFECKADEDYQREPFSMDLGSGKGGLAYNVHSYPTKVPPNAIVPLIEHYLQDGMVLFDPFCGTGMTGVALQLSSVTGTAVLQDLAPVASHIAYGSTSSRNHSRFAAESARILADVNEVLGWLFETKLNDQTLNVRYFVWSDIYACRECGRQCKIWDIEGAGSVGGLKAMTTCKGCGAQVSKQVMDPVLETVFDGLLGEPIERFRQELVMVVAEVGKGIEKRKPIASDVDLVARVDREPWPTTLPTEKMLFKDGNWGDQWRSSYHTGVTHSHHFYTKRNLLVLAAVWESVESSPRDLQPMLRHWFTASLSRLTRLNRYMQQHDRHVGPLSGTLFIGPIQAEISPFYFLKSKISDVEKALWERREARSRVFASTGSSEFSKLPDDSVDYVFTDPPFGENLIYSELNFLAETWLGCFTMQGAEAVVSASQTKTLRDYQHLVENAFVTCYRVLKPNHWISVEFHNSRNLVWVAIQEALANAGFVIADVRTLDKKKGTTKQNTQPGTVKQDLIISAYKPTAELARTVGLTGGSPDFVWQFLAEHLGKLATWVGESGEVIAERQPHLLYDRMLSFHVRHGIRVPVSAADFSAGLSQRFPMRDGMYFLTEQISEYDRKRTSTSVLQQLSLFVSDEASATQWLRQQLQRKPQSFQDLQPLFMQALQSWVKHEQTIELREILSLNFIRYDGKGPVPDQIHGYLSTNYKDLRKLEKEDPRLQAKADDRWYVPDARKEGDLEKLRLRTLLKEFEVYHTSTARKIKQFRTEAVRAGFKHCYDEQDYQTIVDVAAKLPEQIIQEDEKLLMYYDVATMRLGV
jgi:DNA modification methylase